jgi:hypothetical protein
MTPKSADAWHLFDLTAIQAKACLAGAVLLIAAATACQGRLHAWRP